MEWIEASVTTTSEGVEIISALLIENGITGLQIDDDYDMRLFLENNTSHWDYADEELLNKQKGDAIVRFYISADGTQSEVVYSIKNGLSSLINNSDAYDIDLGSLNFETKLVDDKDWIDNWKKYYKPFRIGKNIVIKPVWEKYEDFEKTDNNKDIVFTINPGHVFGTGLHQSTKMCIEQLEEYVYGGERILDVGCGSGILSLISLLLGAESAFALDIDEACVNIAYENAKLNNIDFSSKISLGKEPRYKVTSGNILSNDTLLNDALLKEIGNSYDIVLANIIADVIINLAPIIPQLVKKNGLFISSGIIRERTSEVEKALIDNSFDVIATIQNDEWICIVSKYKG